MSRVVYFHGDEAIIHEPTGVLLKPGANEIADDAHAQELIESGYAHEQATAPALEGEGSPVPEPQPLSDGPHVFSGLTDATENPLVDGSEKAPE